MRIQEALSITRQRQSAEPPSWESAAVVEAPTAGRIKINTTGLTETVPCVAGIFALPGDVVLVKRSPAGSIVTNVITLNVEATGPEPIITEPTSGVSVFPMRFGYDWTWDYWGTGGGVFTYDQRLRCGVADDRDNTDHLWVYQAGMFYQGDPTALAGATVDKARIHLIYDEGTVAGDQFRIVLAKDAWWPTDPLDDPGGWGVLEHDSPDPAGWAVTITAGKPGTDTWAGLPAIVGQAMVDNEFTIGSTVYSDTGLVGEWATNGADGFPAETHVVLKGLTADPTACALEITWHREDN